LILTLPFPPSTNRYWRHWKGRTLLSREGRTYREAAVLAVMKARVQGFGRRKCRVSIVAHMPDARRRDLDNLLKASLDALTAARVFEDDSQVVRLLVEHGGIDRERPRLEVLVEAA
jgi:crossover junction endodeoxyribonuclease RusA